METFHTTKIEYVGCRIDPENDPPRIDPRIEIRRLAEKELLKNPEGGSINAVLMEGIIMPFISKNHAESVSHRAARQLQIKVCNEEVEQLNSLN